jgi:CheY-like chemotaxis protein
MSRRTILVVDDDRSVCAQVSRFLADEGYEVDVAHDGINALEIVTRRDYSLVVLDYRMPGLDGIELYRRIRHLRPETAGIFLTSYTTIDTIFPAISVGIERILAKPVKRDELLTLVEQIIGKPESTEV